jgi:hypothetical protein
VINESGCELSFTDIMTCVYGEMSFDALPRSPVFELLSSDHPGVEVLTFMLLM